MIGRKMLLAVLAIAWQAASADSYSGRIDLLEVKADGTRFFVKQPTLNLYASGQHRDALLEGFYHKAVFAIQYQPFPCPGGMAGKCGTVHAVMVEAAGF